MKNASNDIAALKGPQDYQIPGMGFDRGNTVISQYSSLLRVLQIPLITDRTI